MGLFSRAPAVEVTVTPAEVTPREVVTATVTPTRPLDNVGSAFLEWGYTNFFRYHWAGRADSAVAQASDSMWMTGNVGTNAGGDRDTEEWVGVTKVDLPVLDGEFRGGTSTFRVPSWAPASSPDIARWSCRVQFGERGADKHGEFAVRIGRDDVCAEAKPTEVLMGDAETVIEIELATSVFTAGEAIRGHIRLTPTIDLPDGDLAVCWQRHRESHPLTRTPSACGSIDGPVVKLGKRIPLRARQVVAVPFEVPLPPDAAPTASAVHSSINWFVQARLFYAGFNAHMVERVLRPIVVVNAP